MKYEDVKEKTTEQIDEEVFIEIVIEQMKEQQREAYDKLSSEDVIVDSALASYEHPAYSGMPVRASTRFAIRQVLKAVGKLEAEKRQSEMQVIDVFYVGGNDWKHSKNPDAPPDKQAVQFLTPNGFHTMGVFGHTPTSDVDLIPFAKYRVSYTSWTSQNGKVYDTAKRIELLDLDGSDDEFVQWLARQELLGVGDIEKSDLYNPVILSTQIKWVKPQAIWYEDANDLVHELDKDGRPKYTDTGDPIMKGRSKISDTEVAEIIQSTLDGRDDNLFVGSLILETIEEENYKRYSEVRFYNQRLARHWLDIQLFRDEQQYKQLCLLPAEEGAELMIDDLSSQGAQMLVIAIPVKITRKDSGEDGVKEYVKYNGLFVSDRLLLSVEEEVDKKKVS